MNVHFHFYKLLTPIHILSQINPVHASHLTSWINILILSSHLHLGLPSGLFPSGLHTKTLYATLLSALHATCPAHLILLDFINDFFNTCKIKRILSIITEAWLSYRAYFSNAHQRPAALFEIFLFNAGTLEWIS